MSNSLLKLIDVDEHVKRGLNFHRQGDFEQAFTVYQQILSKYPLNFDGLYLSGVIAAQTKQFSLAVDLIGKAISVNPNHFAAYLNMGNVLLELNRLNEAVEMYDNAIAINPEYPEAYTNRGIALQELNFLDDALSSYDNAISINPKYADAYSNRGNVLQELNRLEDALNCYDKAIEIDPKNAEAHSNRGVALQKLNRYVEAISSFDKAIYIHPNYTKALTNRGVALHNLNLFNEAKANFEQAIGIDPEYVDAFSNLGYLHNDLNNLNEALRCYDIAISIKPDFVDAHINRGITLQELKRIEESLESFDNAISLNSNNAEAYWNKSLTLLLSSNFKQGWELYEWRLKRERFSFLKDNFFSSMWNGNQNLCGKTILLTTEQGLGDTIQFSRYVKLVKSLGANIILETPKSLMKLLDTLDDVDQMIEIGEKLPDFDYHSPLMSLPFAFKTCINSIPYESAYLFANSEKCKEWNSRLGLKRKPRVGIVWSGSTSHKKDHMRSIPLQKLFPYLSVEYDFVSLQKEIREEDKHLLTSLSIRHFGDFLEDFSDTAALCELMDLVISVDTSVAHLSGSIGKKTWVLLPYSPDWRWLLDRNDSPWYNSMTLYRQDEKMDWLPVLDKVFDNLKTLKALIYDN
jgi:hypothetical protein